ncbi:hypothetical protein GIB67_027827 [Kingdonia uniflora]|uniref:DNA helicase n=1 Tax=Kingdonia uniflora TaxID=39325 RepID=A0A7J7MQ07_9MAGN|nr:hypothetical protein GIB67_027827 [Kingdonia uniflora]
MVLSDIEKMVSVIGMIIRCSSLIPEIREAVFQCLVRGYFSDLINVDKGRVNEPKRCGRQECLAINSMTLIHNRSRLDSHHGTSIMVNKASLSARELEVNQKLGLAAGTPVGTSLIDAHAGGLGRMIKKIYVIVWFKSAGRLLANMAVSQNKVFIPGVWGPFWSAMLPEYWLTEGGKSATGALLDYILNNHVAAPHLANHAASQCIFTFELLNKMLESMMNESKAPFLAILKEDLYVLPDFHGNWQIVEHCNSHGHKPSSSVDYAGCTITLPRESEFVLLGAAILGGVAAKKYSGHRDAIRALNSAGQVYN